MELKQIVEAYLRLAGDYGREAPLAAFGWSREETERLFSALDEDYHISRFLTFSHHAGSAEFHINAFPQTHVTFSDGVTTIL